MRRLVFVVTVLFTIGIAASAFAQGPGGGRQRGGQRGGPGGGGRGGMRGSNVAQIPVDIIKAQLKLTPDQTAKIKAIQKKFQADVKALMPAPGAQADRSTFEKMRPLMQKVRTDIEAVLTPTQKAKLPALLDQMRMLRGIGIPAQALPELKLTAAQKTKVAALIKKGLDQMKGVPDDQRRERMRAVVEPLRAEVTKLLTPAQQQVIAKYSQRFGRGGMGGPGGPGGPGGGQRGQRGNRPGGGRQ